MPLPRIRIKFCGLTHPDDISAVGKTLFDMPGSTDLTVTVVVPKDRLHAAPAQFNAGQLGKVFNKALLYLFLGGHQCPLLATSAASSKISASPMACGAS